MEELYLETVLKGRVSASLEIATKRHSSQALWTGKIAVIRSYPPGVE